MTRIATLVALLFAAAFAAAQTPTLRVRGDVVALDGTTLSVRTRAGEPISIRLADNYAVVAVVALDTAAIAAGSYVGAGALPQPDGTLTALEVLVFPEASRGSNEGHYAWDREPGGMMTNATVAAVVRGDGRRRLTLRYKDGEKTVDVPDGAPIVTFEPGERTMLAPGAHLIVTASRQPDGTLTANRIVVGRNGLVPPM